MTSHTWTTLKADTRGAQILYATWAGRLNLVGGAYDLWVLVEETGSCHSPGAWNFQLAPRFIENLCTCGVDCWQKGCWTGSFEGLKQGHRLCELLMHFWATRLDDTQFCVFHSQHTLGNTRGRNANSMLRIPCRFCYTHIFKQGIYMCCKLSTES